MFGTLRNQLSIDGRLRELIILRVAIINRAYYEFYSHYQCFLDEGGTQEECDALGAWSTCDTLWSVSDKVVLTFVDASTKRVQVQDFEFDPLKEHFSSEQIVEIVSLCSGYNMVSRVLEALRVGPESQEDMPAMPHDSI